MYQQAEPTGITAGRSGPAAPAFDPPCGALYSRAMREIIIDPDVCNGRPVIEGTRVTASTVLEFLSAGDSVDDVLAGYPTLTRDDVLACLAYSARLLRHHFEVGAVA